jgi:hypothetical protein
VSLLSYYGQLSMLFLLPLCSGLCGHLEFLGSFLDPFKHSQGLSAIFFQSRSAEVPQQSILSARWLGGTLLVLFLD